MTSARSGDAEQSPLKPAANGLILHLHPSRVHRRALRLTYTFGLGGAAVLLLLVQVVTGALLMFSYRPTPAEAYQSIVTLETQVWFGELIRSLHHWSANLLLVVVFLHLLRVFYTAAFLAPRRSNWLLGLALLGLTLAANFTGCLLPWDQLAYWAVTVGTSLLSYIPLVGEGLRHFLLGGPEAGAVTLSNFYALHVMILPLGVVMLGIYHLWRVRRDRFSTPREAGEPDSPAWQPVATNPHLISRELVFALVVLALLLAWATAVDTPLLPAADPNHPPDPAKAAWYFAGVQELLLYFHPTFGAFVIPALVVAGLILLPYLRDTEPSTGIWFRSMRGRWLALLSLLIGAAAAVGLVAMSGGQALFDGLAFLPDFIRSGLLPLGIILTGLYGYAWVLNRLGVPPGEARMALFTVLVAAFLVLTGVGALLRGPGMALQSLGGILP